MSNRPIYIGQAIIRDWITKDKKRIPGIQLLNGRGIAAHLTADEARALADRLHDLADQLGLRPQATTASAKRQQQSCRPSPLYSTQTLTDATGAPEPPLPATSAD